MIFVSIVTKACYNVEKSYKVKLPAPLTVTCWYNMQSQCIILSNRTSMYFAMKCWLIMWMRLQTMPILRTWINCGSHCTSICIFILFFTEHTKTVLEVAHIDHTPLILHHLTLNRTRFWVSWWHCFIIPSGQNTIAYLLLLLCWSLMRRWTRSKEHWQPTNHHHVQANLVVPYLAMKYMSLRQPPLGPCYLLGSVVLVTTHHILLVLVNINERCC